MKATYHELWLQLPILVDLPGLSARQAWSVEAISAFLAALGSCLPLLETTVSECIGVLGRPPDGVLEALQQQSPMTSLGRVCFVRIQARCEVPIPDESIPRSISRESFAQLIGASNLRDAVSQMLVLSELAYPSLIEVVAGHVIGPTVGTPRRLEKKPLYCLTEDAERKHDWPQVQTLPIDEVVGWAVKAGYGQEGIAKGRVHRAFAAFTHCVGLSESRLGEVLFRSMQGLEAFYCDGNGDLRKQLDDKSQLWLGTMPAGNMSIGKLYEQRSKVIHGGSSISYWPEIFDATPGFSEVESALSGATRYALRLLVATLQKAIRHGIHEVSWSYSVTTDAQSFRLDDLPG